MTRSRSLAIDDLFQLAAPSDPALSPDGERVVYVLTKQDAATDAAHASLWEVRTSGGAPRRLTNGPGDGAPRWSPDGSVLAFVRAGQILLLPADGGEPVALTTSETCPAGAGAAAWSPDGTRIAFAAPTSRRDEIAPVVVDKLRWKADGLGVLGPVRMHLFVVDVATGAVTKVTDGDFNAGQPVWSPDGTRVAFPAAIGTYSDLTSATAVYLADVPPPSTTSTASASIAPGEQDTDATATGTETGATASAAEDVWTPAEPSLVGSSAGIAIPVAWYPAGDALLVVGRQAADVGHVNLLRQPLDDTAATPLAPTLDRNIMLGAPGYPGAIPGFHGDEIVFAARDRGATRLYRLAADGTDAEYSDAVQIACTADYGVNDMSVSAKTGLAAVQLRSRGNFGEIALLDLATDVVRTLTDHMGQSLPDVELFPFTEREFTISDGTVVHAMIHRDPDAPTPGPLLVDVHGGPHNAWAPLSDPVHLYHQELVARGWTVLTVNPRGSDGYGEDFMQAVVGGWGQYDETDFLEPTIALVADGLVDPDRIALTGYSYGGFMSCWLSARTDVFSAVVAGGVVTDLASMAGTSDEGEAIGTLEIGGGKERLAACSPITHIDTVRAPTLILHGAADDRCPVGQAEQWFHGLRVRGVPAQLVLYPGGSHLFPHNGRPSHRADFNRRLVAWVVEHTTG